MKERRDDLLVSEVFSAIQGEGALVGHRQVFLRLTGCNIRCEYCDQPEALERKPGPCRLERTAGRRDWDQRHSPLPFAEVVDAVDRLWRALPHHSVSVTGGEPLMQAGRLASLAPRLVERGHRLSLETNGMLIDGVVRVLPWLSHVSMDIKLDSVDGQGVSLGSHRHFLEVAVAACPTSVKIVVGADTSPDELDQAVAMVAELAPATEVFLQPVTPFGDVTAAPTPEQLLELHDRALRIHAPTRVVPQTHKIIGQL